MPGQQDLDKWAASLSTLLSSEPVVTADAPTTIDGLPARVRATAKGLDWIFVADGFGGLVRCFSKSARDLAWLHEALRSTVMATFTLSHPISDGRAK